jgi:hypothetical protein
MFDRKLIIRHSIWEGLLLRLLRTGSERVASRRIDVSDGLFDETSSGRRGGVVGLGNCRFLVPSQKQAKVSADELTNFNIAESVRMHRDA